MTHLEDLSDRIKPKAASNALLWVIVAFVLIFFIWATFTKLDRTVRAMGKVMPSAQLQTISNLEGGIVKDILVHQGDLVEKGAPLIRLDPTAPGAELGSGEATSSTLSAKTARLTAEVMGREPVYPAADNAGTRTQIEVERALHASRMGQLRQTLDAGRARVTQAERAVGEAEAVYRGRVALRDSKIAQANVIRSLVARGIEPRLSQVQADAEAAGATGDAASSAEGVSRARAGVSEARAMLSAAQQEWRSRAADELATAQGELNVRREQLPALAQRVDRTTVRAPMRGRINRVLVTTRGASTAPGQPMIELVPADDSLLVQVMVRPQDIAAVRIGQQATVAITAYDRAVYGTIDGKVTSISPDAVAQEKSGETFYIVQVRAGARGLPIPGGGVRPIGAGMVAEVDLRGEKRSVLAYILTPLTRMSETAFRER